MPMETQEKSPFRRAIQATIASLLLTTSIMSRVSAQTPSVPVAQLPSPVLASYIYGYAPVAFAATRAIFTAVPDATTHVGFAPINQLARVNALANPNSRLVVRPNADTLYTQAWLDLSFEPMILHLPDTRGRYYLMEMLDAYTNVFASLGARTTGTSQGDYAIIGPNWKGTLPASIAGVVQAPTNAVWLIGRTLVRGQSDLANAVAVTNQYQLMPLTAYPNFLITGNYNPPVNVPVTPPNLDFVAFPPDNSQGLAKPEFFDVLLATSLQNPPPLEQEPLAGLLVGEGALLKSLVTPGVRQQAITAFIVEDQKTGTTVNGWTTHLQNVGNYGSHYLTRGWAAHFGLGTNIPADAVYYHAASDANNNALDGTNNYVIHFAPNQVPPVNGFWSVTVYGDDGFLVENPIKRYSIGSESGLVSNADGSIDILLQSTPPTTLQSNWLPTPDPATAPSSSFNLTLRLFWPDQTVVDGAYTPPVIQPAAAGQLVAK